VNRKASVRRWRPARLVALAVLIALCPLPALAGDQDQPAGKAPGIRASAAAIATRQPLAASPSAAGQGQSNPGKPASFFKSPIGVVVLATLAAGVGYAIYSTQNDRITSPVKQ